MSTNYRFFSPRPFIFPRPPSCCFFSFSYPSSFVFVSSISFFLIPFLSPCLSHLHFFSSFIPSLSLFYVLVLLSSYLHSFPLLLSKCIVHWIFHHVLLLPIPLLCTFQSLLFIRFRFLYLILVSSFLPFFHSQALMVMRSFSSHGV